MTLETTTIAEVPGEAQSSGATMTKELERVDVATGITVGVVSVGLVVDSMVRDEELRILDIENGYTVSTN